MKKIAAVMAFAIGINLGCQTVAAGSGLDGLLLGAGSGALIGQAAGRNTHSTLAGAAVGAMIGYALDNGVDRGSRAYYGYTPRRIVVRPESQETCREMEMLGTIDGRPEKIYGTACWQDGEWVRIDDDWWSRSRPVVYRPLIIEKEIHVGGDRHRHGHHRDHDRRWGGRNDDRHFDRDRHDRGSRLIFRAER